MTTTNRVLTADELALNFLHSAGVETYRDRRRAFWIHVAIWLIMILAVAVLLAATLGPSFIVAVRQIIDLGHQATSVGNWGPQ